MTNRPARPSPHKIFSIPVALYGLGTMFWLLYWLYRGDHGWFMVLLDHYSSLLIILAMLLVIITVWRGYRGLTVLLLPVIIFGIFLFGSYWVPHLQTDPTPPELTVMTFNVLWDNPERTAIEWLLRTHQPDLVALQEVGPLLMQHLAQELGNQYTDVHIADYPAGSTTAILSRYPLENVTQLDLGASRPALLADLRVNEQRITFVSAHLLYYGWLQIPLAELPAHISDVHKLQNRQVQLLLTELAQRESDIVILGCDCNSTAPSASQQILNISLTDAAKASGWVLPQPERPRLGPFYVPQRLDYIFYQGRLQPRGTYTVYDSAGSDHYPVIAYFNFYD